MKIRKCKRCEGDFESKRKKLLCPDCEDCDPNYMSPEDRKIALSNFKNIQLTDIDKKVIKAKILIRKIRRSLNVNK